MAQALGEKADFIYSTASRHPRSLSPVDVSGLFVNPKQTISVLSTPADALNSALNTAREGDLILATGSLFLSAEVREAALGIEPEIYTELPTSI